MDTLKTKVVTGKVRFSYAHVFEPVAIDDGATPKYSVAILIPKDDAETLAKIDAGIKAAMEVGKAKLEVKGKMPKNLKTPLRDGDDERPDDENYEGMMFLNASSTSKPGIVDADLEKLMDKDEFYSGCYGRASINFYAFSVSGNKGIAAGLQNLQKTEDGESLSGGASAEDDFGDDLD